jgi:hypothetical protein
MTVFDTFFNLEPVEWLNDRWYVMRLRNSSDSAGEGVLDELKVIDLSLVKIVVEKVAVVRFGMDYGNGV